MKIYKGIGPNSGKIVAEADAFQYALKECGVLAYSSAAPEFEEFRDMLVEWFFSGNWIEEERRG